MSCSSPASHRDACYARLARHDEGETWVVPVVAPAVEPCKTRRSKPSTITKRTA